MEVSKWLIGLGEEVWEWGFWDPIPISDLTALVWDSVTLVLWGWTEPLWVLNFAEPSSSWIAAFGFWVVGFGSFILWKLWLVEWFLVTSSISGLLGAFGSGKCNFGSSSSFSGMTGTRRGRGLLEACTVLFNEEMVVVFIPVASAEKKDAVKGLELLGSFGWGTGSICASSVTPEYDLKGVWEPVWWFSKVIFFFLLTSNNARVTDLLLSKAGWVVSVVVFIDL